VRDEQNTNCWCKIDSFLFRRQDWGESKVIRISGEPSLLQIVIDEIQLDSVAYLNYLGNMITNDARCTCETIHDRHGKSNVQQEEVSFHEQIGLKFKEETSEMLHLEHGFVWC
jgi:hypothetical protein